MIEYDSAARPPRALEELLDLRAHASLLRALVTRNLKVRYKRSAFGFLWTMASPALMLIVLSLAFTRLFAVSAPAYPAFVFPGLLLWNFFAQTTTMSGEEMTGSDIWKRMRFPKTALAISTLFTGIINLTLALVPLIVILAAAHRPLGLALVTLPLTIVLTAMFVLGASLILASGALHFADVMPAWNMLLPALMFTAPVVYPAAIVPPSLRPWLQLNPMTLYLEAFRAPLYSNSMPAASSLALMLALGVTTLALGWLLFTRSADDIAYRA
ncbi:MAG TPA: ABC transporter permease [Thermoanaerobaculia bacterium]|nr:ABC transporter permease [Thermoanaerobaculia bacterium]